ncbi:Acetylcholinesterase, insect [Penicillium camemberti]|uniref:Carboxylic ester hydrolase n=1 Tax=Penicillium camemberti (strain FM 013) TaxID=1429867 RepID=A0A0G4PKJ5_PENC3|nr:Acetylcholinesterase, insect [Penicillium camemberti]
MKLLSTLAGVAACGSSIASALSPPVIDTHYGTIHGGLSPFRGGDKAFVYKGIPYAQPPTGANRWTKVGGPSKWGTLNATEFGPQCAQTISDAGIFSSGKTTTSEDCLYLNVWTPAYKNQTNMTTKKLPVLFWIYGGRFAGGSGDVKTYDGTGLAQKDIIVVTINYRLGPFGFLAHPELAAESGHNSSGNYGILDQQAALHWVNENIQLFGGDPNQITVGGQSAGSASALDVMWSPLAEGLAEGIISESGARGTHDPMTGTVATSYRTKTAAEKQGVAFLKEMNVTSISQLRNVSMEALLEYDSLSDTIWEGTPFGNLSETFMEPPMWRPNIDGYVFTDNYSESLRNNSHADIPILTGSNKDESGASPTLSYNASTYQSLYGNLFGDLADEFFALYPGANSTQATESANEFYRDLSRVGTWGWAVDWAAGGAKSNVYTYYFTHAPAENREKGAYHGSELWYTFNNIPYSSYSNVTWNSADYAVENKMASYWANFIRTGNPNGNGLPQFKPTTKASQKTMWLGDAWGMGPLTMNSKRIQFLQKWTARLPAW